MDFGHEDVVKLLLDYKVNINYEKGAALKLAQDQNHSDITKLLLEHITADRDAEEEE